MDITCGSVADTLRVGRVIAQYLKAGDIICLYGGLGAGKTVLSKGIASGLGIQKEEVISPTFVLIRQYHASLTLNHFDLYRLNEPREIAVLGYEEYLYSDGVSVIEWAERLGSLTPREFLKVELRISGAQEGRLIKLTALGKRYEELLTRVNRKLKSS
ncbi:MAG: tRNA (adenosine(37)-N6)-threonylcarbamoyltransferase complex ATPase subunit type 1 TsaE [Candidatus Omnitrophota bacterium]|jgi:tRNA threonylcarbamoyladenosine biosynthesis protein TsaE